jgi:Mlc titration factor MtfA (ptsG expression regulator)
MGAEDQRMLRWWRNRKRARILAEPFPDEWLRAIERDVALWRAVPEESRPRLLDDARLFIAERYWEPCGGIELTPSMCAVIAVQACVLTLGRSVDAFDHVRSILVYPTAYHAPDVWEDEAGIVTEGFDEREGEAWEWGTVVLSWQQVLTDSRTLHGRNLVLHELAHQLDLLDAVDRPGLQGAERRAVNRRWMETFLDAHEAFCEQVDRGRRVKALDEYGAEDEAEFFAVSTESFFERGATLKEHHPNLYQVLSEYYNQDPAGWTLPAPATGPRAESGRDRRRRRREEERQRRKAEGKGEDA